MTLNFNSPESLDDINIDFEKQNQSSVKRYTWRLDSTVQKSYLLSETGDLKEYPRRKEIFRYNAQSEYDSLQIIYDDFNRQQNFFNRRYESRISNGSDKPEITIDKDISQWNQTFGSLKMIHVENLDTCIQEYWLDTMSQSWVKRKLECTSTREKLNTNERTTTIVFYPVIGSNPLVSKRMVIDSNSMITRETTQSKKNNESDEWFTTREIIYKYNGNKLLEKLEYIYYTDREELVLAYHKLRTILNANEDLVESWDFDASENKMKLNYKENSTTSNNGLNVKTEYYAYDERLKELYKDRDEIKYFNAAGFLMGVSVYNYRNGGYDRVEKIYKVDKIGRITHELILQKNNESIKWDTLQQETFGYNQANVKVKSMIHHKSRNRDTGMPIDYYPFRTNFDSLNNLIEFYTLSYSSNEAKVVMEYLYDINDSEVLYPSSVSPLVGSSEGLWQKVNPVKTRSSYYLKEGHWYPQIKKEYFYSRIKH